MVSRPPLYLPSWPQVKSSFCRPGKQASTDFPGGEVGPLAELVAANVPGIHSRPGSVVDSLANVGHWVLMRDGDLLDPLVAPRPRRGVDYSGALEKAELGALLERSYQ